LPFLEKEKPPESLFGEVLLAIKTQSRSTAHFTGVAPEDGTGMNPVQYKKLNSAEPTGSPEAPNDS